jgi:hypothetical protein
MLPGLSHSGDLTMPRPRLFSIGYAEHQPADLRRLALGLNVTVLDVRSRPSGRVKRGFSRRDLEALLGERYEWWGDVLGGKGAGVTTAGLDRLAADRRRLLLLCLEACPGDCHRHRIALDLARRGIPVFHVFENELIEATELQRAIDADDEYEYEELADVIAAVRSR